LTVQLETLDILADILNHFGTHLINYHLEIFGCLIAQLNSQRLAVRKRAIAAIGFLVASCNSTLFSELLQVLLNELKKKQTNSSLSKTYIQCLAAISRQAGHRVGENLPQIVPLIVHYCQCEDEELVEYSLQAFESFVRRCPKEISPYIRQVKAELIQSFYYIKSPSHIALNFIYALLLFYFILFYFFQYKLDNGFVAQVLILRSKLQL
jgi:cullin-associated NEDD8-dissociated protein 1